MRRKRVREDYMRDLRRLRGEPEEPPPASRQLAPDERCRCGGPLMLVGGRSVCALGTHDD
ncbi:hypothetical protein HPC49_25160 [Pyxidicoccus fallax]|uniref:Uncharacterized protein n=1 Tax=Pyxidicoccus fallax TaxID=394095 RepID=A0A848L5B6_9BACT|nr:hypothetical protein [Pyxidicoccus fallax]NMO14150.1 hypothetical protein [Pyxidicoccus fallax]NPC81505.1 hypothetical protein [Pyxidicoccus fallax]